MLDYSKEKESMGEQVDPFDLTKKQEADLQRIRQFRLIDDVFMNKVFEDKSCVELLLQIILNRTDLYVKNVDSQHGISNLQGRAVRLDILAVDDSGKIYNIEVQKNDHGAQTKRARYNSSLLDANITEAGNQYENLKETYVIFITENDVMQAGHPIYHIDRIVKETGENFNDEAHIIYVNAQIQDETALGKLMHDFFCVNAENMKYSILAERVRYFKETKKGVVDMSSVMEELIEEGIAKGREMEKIEERNRFNRMIKSLIENKVSDVQIMKSRRVRRNQEEKGLFGDLSNRYPDTSQERRYPGIFYLWVISTYYI